MVVCCPDERFPLMEILFFVLFLIVSNCRHHCNGERSPKNREKVIEDYVLSAKFDGKPNLPQLRMGYPKKESNHHQGSADYGDLHSYGVYEDVIEDPYSGNSNSLAERDLMVHHHHVAAAPPPPPPPIPPPPVAVDQRPAFFAVGLIAFLMLLNALQWSLLYQLQPKPGALLGSVAGALGRRRRSIQHEIARKNLWN
ncbi:hypothetical protein RUM44_010530 [Polyplax serrata]|uniref:Uncharacterized protein n=1 Tax=Polyplax serrata TaxID=468196 RepID=A0ABR1AVU7_POLSC